MTDRKFSGPVEYDPSLVQKQTATNGKSASSKMASDLGFDDADVDVDLDGGVEGADGGDGSNRNFDISQYVLASEYDMLVEELKKVNLRKLEIEGESKKKDERMDQLVAMHKSAQSILSNRHKAAYKALKAEITQKQQCIDEDEMQIVSLRKKIALLESGGNTSEVDGKLKDYRNSRQIELENATLQNQLRESRDANAALEEEVKEHQGIAQQAMERLQHIQMNRSTAESVEKQNLIDTLKLEKSQLMTKLSSLETAATMNGSLHGSSESDKLLIESLKKTNTESQRAIKQLQLNLQQSFATSSADGSKLVTELQQAHSQIKMLQIELLKMRTQNISDSGDAQVEELVKLKQENLGLQDEKEKREELLRKSDQLMRKREEQLKQLKENAQGKLKEASEHIKKLKTEYANLREAYKSLKSLNDEQRRELEGARAESQRGLSQEETHRMQGQVDHYRMQLDDVHEAYKLLQEENRQLMKASEGVALKKRRTIDSRKGTLMKMMQLTRLYKEQVAELKNEVLQLRGFIPAYAKQILQGMKVRETSAASELKALQENYEKEIKLRKKLFNQLQELKGNIRVYARVRPMDSKEKADQENMRIIQVPREGELIIDNRSKATKHAFEFEKVFSPTSTQSEVFDEVQDLVTSVLDGFNVCIFAYGQTGSGKTFTMEGPKESPGVNIRALAKLFDDAAEKSNEWNFTFNMTVLEIYNEVVQDLLSDSNQSLKVVKGKDGMEVQGINIVGVKNADEVQKWMTKGKKNRHTSATAMNDQSSRSHLVISITVQGSNRFSKSVSFGKLHLIDLAGSERVSRSGVTGDALKEAQKINLSLSALGNVISARATKKDHVPYRDSMLTFLLQDSLEKNSKTLMFVQLSPTLASVGETLCSLRFAERVRKVELGKAEKNQRKEESKDEYDD